MGKGYIPILFSSSSDFQKDIKDLRDWLLQNYSRDYKAKLAIKPKFEARVKSIRKKYFILDRENVIKQLLDCCNSGKFYVEPQIHFGLIDDSSHTHYENSNTTEQLIAAICLYSPITKKQWNDLWYTLVRRNDYYQDEFIKKGELNYNYKNLISEGRNKPFDNIDLALKIYKVKLETGYSIVKIFNDKTDFGFPKALSLENINKLYYKIKKLIDEQ